MAKNKEEKTNVMRTLDQRKVPYTPHTYDPNGPVDGVSVAAGVSLALEDAQATRPSTITTATRITYGLFTLNFGMIILPFLLFARYRVPLFFAPIRKCGLTSTKTVQSLPR